MDTDREAIQRRFIMNMKRVRDITHLIHSGIPGLNQTAIFQSEGVRADLLRSLVVFLHAAIEDVIRSHLPKRGKFSFSSSSDIKKALASIGIETAQFDDVLPALNQLARRRIQIVHFADLKDAQSDFLSPWGLADDWSLVQWNLAVLVLFRRLRKSTGHTGHVENRALENVEAAIKLNADFGRKLLEVSGMPPEQHLDGIRELVGLADRLTETLKLDVQMFLDANGQPIEGAL
jgi:hypothetical protein